MNDDIIKILEDCIDIFEGAEDVYKTAVPEVKDKILAPMKDLYERIKNILHIHLGQASQQLAQLQKVAQIDKVKSLLQRQENFLEDRKSVV